MSEDRLIEITSNVSVMNGPLVILGYLSSLSESDMYLFLKYVKASKYREKNFYDAVKLFSSDYLLEKEISNNNDSFLEFWYTEGKFDNYFSKNTMSR